MFVFCLLNCSLGAAQKGCGLWLLFEVEPEVGVMGAEGKGGAIMAVGGRRLLLASRPGPPWRPFLRGAFSITGRPRGFGRLRSSAISVGPNPSPEAYALAKMGKGSCGWRDNWRCVGQADVLTSDKTSTLNSLERISESGRKTAAPTSHCSLAITSFWVLLNSPSNHTEPHSETMWKGNLDLTHCLESLLSLGSRGQGRLPWWWGWQATSPHHPLLHWGLASRPASGLAVFQECVAEPERNGQLGAKSGGWKRKWISFGFPWASICGITESRVRGCLVHNRGRIRFRSLLGASREAEWGWVTLAKSGKAGSPLHLESGPPRKSPCPFSKQHAFQPLNFCMCIF